MVVAWLFSYSDESETLPLERLARSRATTAVEVLFLVALACAAFVAAG